MELRWIHLETADNEVNRPAQVKSRRFLTVLWSRVKVFATSGVVMPAENINNAIFLFLHYAFTELTGKIMSKILSNQKLPTMVRIWFQCFFRAAKIFSNTAFLMLS